MKKLFTLVALLAMVLGANAQAGKWTEVYTIDYSTYQGFPFYVMGYVPEFDNGCMADFGANYKYVTLDNEAGETSDVIVKTAGGTEYYKIPLESPGWHQYFIADGIPTKIDGKYKVVAKVKATAAASINVNMGWGWGDGQQVGASVAIPGDTEFQEVEWEYSAIGGSSCNLVAQPGTVTETIEWASLTVYEWVKEGGRVPEWLEDIDNGDAEQPWGELANVKFNDEENNFKICAWGKEKGVNMNENEGWDPFPATIEEEGGNHFFVVHGKAATTEGDASAWDNQFWIQSKHAWKGGTTLKIKFRYKASKAVTVATQCHKQNPSDYLIWHAIGDINFTEDWQTFEKDMAIADDMVGTWSIAFQLNQNDKEAIDFYFDDLSWKYLKLDEGYFVSGINSKTATSYDDLDNAIEFQEGVDWDDAPCLVATVGEAGNANSYVDQVMVSTTRGDDQAFKGATLKQQGKVSEEDWLEYAASTNAKIDLPGLGVWRVYLDTEYKTIGFKMLEGTKYEEQDPIDVVTNKTQVIVKGQERQPTSAEEEGGTGQAWDNQFFLVANRVLQPGEVTVLKFKYKASKGTAEAPVKTTTQCHGKPGGYIHWGAIGDVMFTEEWQDFEQDFTIPKECTGEEGKQMECIAFNMAEIKEACDYEITDVQWYLKDETLDEGKTYENLINAEGTANFYVKEGAGTDPHEFGKEPAGIKNVVNNSNNGSAVIYNLAGQRVSKDFKGIVVKEGRKAVQK